MKTKTQGAQPYIYASALLGTVALLWHLGSTNKTEKFESVSEQIARIQKKSRSNSLDSVKGFFSAPPEDQKEGASDGSWEDYSLDESSLKEKKWVFAETPKPESDPDSTDENKESDSSGPSQNQRTQQQAAQTPSLPRTPRESRDAFAESTLNAGGAPAPIPIDAPTDLQNRDLDQLIAELLQDPSRDRLQRVKDLLATLFIAAVTKDQVMSEVFLRLLLSPNERGPRVAMSELESQFTLVAFSSLAQYLEASPQETTLTARARQILARFYSQPGKDTLLSALRSNQASTMRAALYLINEAYDPSGNMGSIVDNRVVRDEQFASGVGANVFQSEELLEALLAAKSLIQGEEARVWQSLFSRLSQVQTAALFD